MADVRVSDLSGARLNYWVARAEGKSHELALACYPALPYSTDWGYGGPIVEQLIRRGHVFIQSNPEEPVACVGPWFREEGWTMLECACRTWVTARFGPRVAAAATAGLP